jgi:stage II sporulation protein D
MDAAFRPPPTFRRRRSAVTAVAAFVAAIMGLLALASPSPAATATTMAIEGRGWGHGIGMSQYGAYGYAKHGWTYGAIVTHYYTGVTLGKVGDPTVRVLLNRGLSSVKLTAASRFRATWGTKKVAIAGGTSATVTWSGGAYRLTVGAKTWRPGAPVMFTPGSSQLKLLTANDNGYVGHYRGRLRVLHLTDGLMAVNWAPLERYLYGVVPRESPSSWPIEALKAQAVAARSYAYRSLGGSGAFDVYCTTSSQMYGGADGEAASSNQAVDATRGIVPKYGGTPITAFFFSTSGGHTENIENVWGGASPVPYLKGVSDPYDTASPYHAWPENPRRRTPSSIAGALGFSKGPLRAIYALKRGTSPRIVKALIIGDGGYTVTDGATLRVRLGLRDTWMFFTSLSITPSASTHRKITYGSSTTLTGRRYPALGSGATVTLHRRPSGGSWATAVVAATAGSRSVGGYTVKLSDYKATVSPLKTTEYYFTSPGAIKPDTAISAHTTIAVRPAVSIDASTTTPATGATVTFSGAVKPAGLAGATVWLQTQTASGWQDKVSAKLASGGTYSIGWTAVAGATALRLRVPASSALGLVQGTSPAVTVTGS